MHTRNVISSHRLYVPVLLAAQITEPLYLISIHVDVFIVVKLAPFADGVRRPESTSARMLYMISIALEG